MAATAPDLRLSRAEALDLAATLPPACCDLIYVDPPFLSGARRTLGRGRMAFRDAAGGDLKRHLRFLHDHLSAFHRLLAPHATLWLHLDPRSACYARVLLDALFGADCFVNEIIWHYRTGGAAKRWFARKHDTILVYARAPGRHRFFPQRGGEYRTDGLRYDGDRPYKSTRKGRVLFHPAGPLLDDVWDLPFLSTVALERTGWPTQKPLALLERIIHATTRTGDVVADFFCGSGTTLVAARKLGRKALGCDRSATAVRVARRRLDRLAADR